MVTMTEFTNCTYFTAEFFMMNMKVLFQKLEKFVHEKDMCLLKLQRREISQKQLLSNTTC
jgi:hypothetical protein